MTYKNQKKVYLCIPIIVAILYSVQNIVRTVCVWERVCVCYESLMSITMVQCSIKVKSKGQQTCYKKTHKMSPFCPNLVFLQTQSAASSSLNGFHSDFQSWSSWGLSHGADYASLSREMLRGFIKKHKKKHPYSDVLTENALRVTISFSVTMIRSDFRPDHFHWLTVGPIRGRVVLFLV